MSSKITITFKELKGLIRMGFLKPKNSDPDCDCDETVFTRRQIKEARKKKKMAEQKRSQKQSQKQSNEPKFKSRFTASFPLHESYPSRNQEVLENINANLIAQGFDDKKRSEILSNVLASGFTQTSNQIKDVGKYLTSAASDKSAADNSTELPFGVQRDQFKDAGLFSTNTYVNFANSSLDEWGVNQHPPDVVEASTQVQNFAGDSYDSDDSDDFGPSNAFFSGSSYHGSNDGSVDVDASTQGHLSGQSPWVGPYVSSTQYPREGVVENLPTPSVFKKFADGSGDDNFDAVATTDFDKSSVENLDLFSGIPYSNVDENLLEERERQDMLKEEEQQLKDLRRLNLEKEEQQLEELRQFNLEKQESLKQPFRTLTPDYIEDEFEKSGNVIKPRSVKFDEPKYSSDVDLSSSYGYVEPDRTGEAAEIYELAKNYTDKNKQDLIQVYNNLGIKNTTYMGSKGKFKHPRVMKVDELATLIVRKRNQK